MLYSNYRGVEEQPKLEIVKSKNDKRTHDSLGRERTHTRTIGGTPTLKVASHHTSLVTLEINRFGS